ncbi:hypothetical protein [Actinotalea subterranea]|nr:hypothetical protein [Actinotalea subterranea]
MTLADLDKPAAPRGGRTGSTRSTSTSASPIYDELVAEQGDPTQR